MISSRIIIDFESKEKALNACESINIDQEDTKRSNIKMSVKDKKLVITLKTSDLVAFRAASNTIARLLCVHQKISEV